MKRTVAGLALTLLFPLAAHAYEGYVVADVNLRAGPDVGYPPITMLPAGAPVSIQGCIGGWTWCDVIAGPDRGWIAGTYLEEPYRGNRVIVTDYGASIGIPVVAFSIGAYWGHYYRERPWYHDRVRWEHYNWGNRAPPRPASWSGSAYRTNWNGGQTRYGRDSHGTTTATTASHRGTYAGYGTTYRNSSTGVRHVAAAPAIQRPTAVHAGRTVAPQHNRAYAQQRGVTTRSTQAQARTEARTTAVRARPQQASAEGHGRAVHQANANAHRGGNAHGNRDHDNEHR